MTSHMAFHLFKNLISPEDMFTDLRERERKRERERDGLM